MRVTKRWAAALLLAGAGAVQAGEVAIEQARLSRSGDGSWSVAVTLRHADSGWEHYADAWRLVEPGGAVIATRTLYHPHVDEQPFTRSLGGVRLPAGLARLAIEAHDNVHGWSSDRLEIDLGRASAPRYRIE